MSDCSRTVRRTLLGRSALRRPVERIVVIHAVHGLERPSTINLPNTNVKMLLLFLALKKGVEGHLARRPSGIGTITAALRHWHHWLQPGASAPFKNHEHGKNDR